MQYMGFPGTLGAWYVPYLVADSVVAPPEMASAYTEKMLFLPRRYFSFQ
jgi:protein O-GlcNAc transferase